jgi:hypothetical protein
MKIKNSTHYPTDALKKIVNAVIKCCAPAKLEKKRLRVEFGYRRSGSSGVSFSYWPAQHRFNMRLPKGVVPVPKLATNLRYALWLCTGFTKRQIPDNIRLYAPAGVEPVIAANPLVLTEVVPAKAVPKAPADRRTARYQQLCSREAAWESKLKRAENALQKIRKQKKYYERLHNEAVELEKLRKARATWDI